MERNQLQSRPGYRAALRALAGPLLLGVTMHAGAESSASVDGAWHSGPGNPVAAPASLDGQVRSMLADAGNRCYIGGGFDAPFDAVAYWNGTSYQSAGIQFWTGEASTNAMIEYQGQVYAAGRFPVQSATAILMRLQEENGLAMWTPLIFCERDDGQEGLSLTVHDDLLWIGGEFELPDGTRNIATWDGVNTANQGDANGPVRALASHEGLLYAGGDFTNVGAGCPPEFPECPFSEENIAVWNGSWTEAFGGADASVYALHSVADPDPMSGLYIGGDFTRLGSSFGHGGVARVQDPNEPASVDVMDGGPWDGRIRTIQRWGRGIAVGGTFNTVGNTNPATAFNVANWSTTAGWESMDLGLEGMVTDQPYGAAVLALARFVNPDSEGLHAGGNFSSYGSSLDLCHHAARFFDVTTYEAITTFVTGLENGEWEEIDEYSYRLSQVLPDQPTRFVWGVEGARFQRMAWDPESLLAESRLFLRSSDARIPNLSVYRPAGPGPFLPAPVLEISPSLDGAPDAIRIGCVTGSGEIIESPDFILDQPIRIDISSLVEGVDAGIMKWDNGRTYNMGIRVGNPADTLVATDLVGAEIFRAENVVRIAISMASADDQTPHDFGRSHVELTGDLVFKTDRSGFGVEDELHRLGTASAPDAFEILEGNPLHPAGVVYSCEEAGRAFEIEGTSFRDSSNSTGPLFSRRSLKLASARPGESYGVRVEDRREGLADPRNTLEMDCFQDRLDALFRFDHPDLRGRVTYLGAAGETEVDIPDDLTFEVIVDTSNGVEITEDDESGTTTINWTNPGLVVFGQHHGLPAIEGPTGMVIGKVEGADGDDTWDVLQRSYMRVVSTKKSDIFVSETEFTIIESEDDGPTGDLNGDGIVNGADLALILASWGACPDCDADLNGDDLVNGADLAFILAEWNHGFQRNHGGSTRQRR